MEVAGNCLQWPHSPSVPHFLRLPHTSPSPSLSRRRSLDRLRRTHRTTLTRSLSSGFTNDGESDDDFVKRIQHLVLEINQQTESTPLDDDYDDPKCSQETNTSTNSSVSASSVVPFSAEPPWPAVRPERRDDDLVVPASVQRRANIIRGLPLSLRIIKKKKRREENLSVAVDSAVKKAFSSMVFIVRELQSYTLQMREVLFYENLQGVLARVQEDMNSSFVWLFQKIFPCTPTLMVCVMLLLANFMVHSISSGSALAAPVPIPQSTVIVIVEGDYKQDQDTGFDSSAAAVAEAIETIDIGKTASVDGGDGGSGGAKLVAAGGADDDSYFNGGGGGVVVPDEEAVVWNRMVEEVTRMREGERGDALMDRDTLRSLVAPVKAEAEPEVDYEEHLRTEIMYHRALALDPENTLLLSNFAQFLYLVLHDHDRAEYYFKRAVGIKPADPESLSRYANFLWLVRKDLGAAEEAYLEAIAAEPSNTYYAANYAHFLWNTGGEDTCYPLDGDNAC
ncbi:Uncharacterized protein M6B38_227525 [Iris pallida]|uniref:Uncharacterized protein n=1 Tax=Iris pallida TaxID=29817 RepID=A0AAX6DTT3_IRIPA|nr:Uncharacterized protein M6B38_227525 [Iris pallida]